MKECKTWMTAVLAGVTIWCCCNTVKINKAINSFDSSVNSLDTHLNILQNDLEAINDHEHEAVKAVE